MWRRLTYVNAHQWGISDRFVSSNNDVRPPVKRSTLKTGIFCVRCSNQQGALLNTRLSILQILIRPRTKNALDLSTETLFLIVIFLELELWKTGSFHIVLSSHFHILLFSTNHFGRKCLIINTISAALGTIFSFLQ